MENLGVNLLTVEDVRARLKIGRNKAYDIFARDDFPAILIGRKYVIEETALKKWLQERRTK